MSNQEFLIQLGSKIRAARKEKGITLQELCEATEIARDNLSLVERGKRNPHIISLKIIAEKLGVDIKDLV